jgi:hypothetical protein
MAAFQTMLEQEDIGVHETSPKGCNQGLQIPRETTIPVLETDGVCSLTPISGFVWRLQPMDYSYRYLYVLRLNSDASPSRLMVT